jgi:hypothetical protein
MGPIASIEAFGALDKGVSLSRVPIRDLSSSYFEQLPSPCYVFLGLIRIVNGNSSYNCGAT